MIFTSARAVQLCGAVKMMAWLALWTVLLLVSMAGFVASANGLRFERRVASEARALAAKSSSGELEHPHDRSALPAPVARYVALAAPGDRAAVRTARVRHRGEIRTAPDKPWMSIRGFEILAADPPGFLWWGRMRVAPGIWVDARDRLVDGTASMKIVAESTVTLSDVRGPELDQGAMLRVLGEMTWIPTAFLDARYVTWTEIDDASARATLRIDGREVSAVFHFGEDGMPERVTANRYRDVNGKALLTPWTGRWRDYRDVGGLRLPFEVESIWELDTGPFTTLRFVVDTIELNATSSEA